MATVRFPTNVRTSILMQILDAIDVGAGPGTIEVYTGSQPESANDAATGTLLGTLTFSYPCGTVAAGGPLTASAITQDSSADASGTAGWARIADSAGNTVMDINVSATGGAGALQLNTTTIVAGGPIQVTSFVVSVP